MNCILCTSNVKANKIIVFINKKVPNEKIELCDVHCSNTLKNLEGYSELKVLDIK